MLTLLVACSNPPSSPFVRPAGTGDCDASGTVCTWLGVLTIAGISDDGYRLATWLYLPVDIAFDADGTAALADYNNHRIRAIDADGFVTTISGTSQLGEPPSDCPAGCPLDGVRWNHPIEAVPRDGSIYVVALHDDDLDRIDPAAGTLTSLTDPGALSEPSSLAIADDGTIFIGDSGNHVVRSLAPDGTLTLVAGTVGRHGYTGDGGPATDARLDGGFAGLGLAVADGVLYVADTGNSVVRTVDLASGVIATLAGTGTPGYADGPAATAAFDHPRDVAIGVDGEVYVADVKNHCVRAIADGQVTTVAGVCGSPGASGDGGPAVLATLDEPEGVAVDPDGNLYVADTNNQVVRRVAR